ncbi:MAG: ABC transporter substrate-binding protein [Methanoregula sp.]|nr:ABC transporter substrate-binding protein [Methanoregula sp.]
MPDNNQKVAISISLSVVGVMLGFLLLLIFFSGCMQQTGVSNNTITNVPDQPVVVNDMLGNRIVLAHPAERIIARGNAVLMLIAIGSGDKIIGTDQEILERKDIRENLRPDVINIGKTGGGGVLNLETVSQLKPDVHIAYMGSFARNADKYRAINCTVFFYQGQGLETLNDEAYALGEITGNREGAQRYIQFNRKYQDLVEFRLANITHDEMLTIYGESQEYYVMPPKSIGGQIIADLHGINVYENQNSTDSQILSQEWLFTKDPDVIIKIEGWEGWGRPFSISSTYERITNRTGYNNLTAVKSNRVYIIHSELTHTPMAVVGEVYLAKALYPDKFADIDPEAVRQEYIREFHVSNYTAEWFYPPFEPVNAALLHTDEPVNR